MFYLMSCVLAVMTFGMTGCGSSSSSTASPYSGSYTFVSTDATYTYTSLAVIDTASPPAIKLNGQTVRKNKATGEVKLLPEVFSALVITNAGVTFKVAGTDEKGSYNETYSGIRNANGNLIGTYVDPSVPGGDVGAWNAVLSTPLAGTYTLVSKDAVYTYTSTAIINSASATPIQISGTTQRKKNADGTISQLVEVFSNLTVVGNVVTFKVTGSDETGAYNETYSGLKDVYGSMAGTYVDPSKPTVDLGVWSAYPAIPLAATYTFVSIDATYTYTTIAVIDNATPPTIKIVGTTARKSATGIITQLPEVYSNLVVTGTGVTFQVSGVDEKGPYNETYTGVRDSNGDLVGNYLDPSLPTDLGAWVATK